MNRSRENEKDRRSKAKAIRDQEITHMAEHRPSANAAKEFNRQAYYCPESVAEYVKRVRGRASGQKRAEELQDK